MLNYIRNQKKNTGQVFLQIGKMRNTRFPSSYSSSFCWKVTTALALKKTQKPKWSRQFIVSSSLPTHSGKVHLTEELRCQPHKYWEWNYTHSCISHSKSIGKNALCKHSKSQNVVLCFHSSFALVELENVKDVQWIEVWVGSVSRSGELATEGKSTWCWFSEDFFMCFTDLSRTEYYKLCDLYDKIVILKIKFKDKMKNKTYLKGLEQWKL